MTNETADRKKWQVKYAAVVIVLVLLIVFFAWLTNYFE